MKKLVLALSVFFMAFVFIACGDDNGDATEQTPATENDGNGDEASEPATEGGFVGVSMPSLALERWERDGLQIEAELIARGFTVDLQFAQDEVATQMAQIENMIASGVDILVIAPIDGAALSTILDQAEAANIPVIAYDRLISNHAHVSYYTTFDNYLVGQTQGQFILDALGISGGEEGPFNIELFAGSPDDNNAHLFFGGAMGVLQPYLDSGVLVVQSGQTEMLEVAIPGWGSGDAQTRMDNLLTANFADGTELHAVLSPNDSLALGIVSSLQASAFTPETIPVVTGQDGDVANINNILAGYQAMSIFKDTRTLATVAVDMVEAILTGGSVAGAVEDPTYDNGVIIVPTYLVGVEVIVADNVYELIVESGFHPADLFNFE